MTLRSQPTPTLRAEFVKKARKRIISSNWMLCFLSRKILFVCLFLHPVIFSLLKLKSVQIFKKLLFLKKTGQRLVYFFTTPSKSCSVRISTCNINSPEDVRKTCSHCWSIQKRYGLFLLILEYFCLRTNPYHWTNYLEGTNLLLAFYQSGQIIGCSEIWRQLNQNSKPDGFLGKLGDE